MDFPTGLHAATRGRNEDPMKVNVLAQAAGGAIKHIQASTVQDAREQLGLPENYQAQVDGEVQDEDYELSTGKFVTFTVKTKGNQA